MVSERGAVGKSPIVRVCTTNESVDDAVLNTAREASASVPVVEVGSVGNDALSPVVLATDGDRTAYHVGCDRVEARTIVERMEEGELPTHGARHVVEHDPETGTLPVPETGVLSVGERRSIAPCGWVVPGAVDDYGELVAERVRGDPEGFREDCETLGLRGRGRGDGSQDDPVAPIWERVREADGEPVVVVNGNEADRSARAAEMLLEGAPIAVLDGAAAVAAAVGAEDVVVYANEADDLALERCEVAAGAVEEALPWVDVQVASGPDEYKAGEMTMALESLEGNDRIEARRSPPGPETHGLFGRPTAIHTPRTFAQIRTAISEPDRFDPEDSDPGTRVVTVAGDVEDPAIVELPTGGSLSTALEAVEATKLKAACVGGQFGGITRDVDLPPSAPAMRAANLGTNGVIELFDDERCMLALVGKRAVFAREGNCGRCVPCRNGSKQLVELLRDIYDGDYDGDGIRELTRVMRRSSICYFGQAASRPVTTAMDAFATEFAAHARDHCPAGECEIDEQTSRRPGSAANS